MVLILGLILFLTTAVGINIGSTENKEIHPINETVKANGITLAYESFGSTNKETIILIQGTSATSLHYPAELCEELADKGYRVIRFDNRDIGLSSKLDSLGAPDWASIFPFVKTCSPAPLPYSLRDMAQDVTGLMDALGIEKAHIVGTSMGGAIAQLMAIDYPLRLLTLTCISATTGNPDRPPGKEKALSAMAVPPPPISDTTALVKHLVTVYKALGGIDDNKTLEERALAHVRRSWDQDGINRQVAAVLIGDYCDRRETLSQITIPTMIIHGDEDPLVPIESGRELANSIPNAQFCTIQGLGHDISLKFVPEIVNCILRNIQNDQ